jgi:hypothetical protein
MNYVGLGTMLRYRFATGNYRPFVNIGLANNYCLNETNTQEAYHKFYTAERTDFGKGIEEFRRYEQAILLGGGISFKQVSAEIRGELGNGISSLGNLAAKKKIIGLLLGFHLN